MAFFWKRNKNEQTHSSSVLGLDRSIEELKAQEIAVEKEFGVRFNKAIAKTRDSINNKLDTIFQGRKQIDEAFLDELEEMLISTDIGVSTTLQILEAIRKGVSRQEINDLDALKAAMKRELLDILKSSERSGISSETQFAPTIRPYVLMVVGVNGVGKTTTIGKIAQRIKNEGNDVLICAADTFRAAASEQLQIWATRAGVPLIQQKQGTDPAAVLFDALQSAKARNSDVLIVDTAGRLHNKANLMAELEKTNCGQRSARRTARNAARNRRCNRTKRTRTSSPIYENRQCYRNRFNQTRRNSQRRNRSSNRKRIKSADKIRRNRRTS
jgi:fused signal recognition particle receptor